MDFLPIRLTRTPASALASLLVAAERAGSPRQRTIDALSLASGVAARDLGAIVARERLPTLDDADELAAIAAAADLTPGSLAFGLSMQRAMDDSGEGDEGKAEDGADPDEGPTLVRQAFVMSTAEVDRARDIVGQSWDLSAFKANPVAPWGHRSDMPPIGVWEDVRVMAGRLRGVLVCHPVPSYDLSETVAEYLRRGVIRTVSVGFLPGAAIPRYTLDESDSRYGDRGVFFDRNELLECSPVTVPMNAGALSEPATRDTNAPEHPEPDDPKVERVAPAWLTAAPPAPSLAFLS